MTNAQYKHYKICLFRMSQHADSETDKCMTLNLIPHGLVMVRMEQILHTHTQGLHCSTEHHILHIVCPQHTARFLLYIISYDSAHIWHPCSKPAWGFNCWKYCYTWSWCILIYMQSIATQIVTHCCWNHQKIIASIKKCNDWPLFVHNGPK